MSKGKFDFSVHHPFNISTCSAGGKTHGTQPSNNYWLIFTDILISVHIKNTLNINIVGLYDFRFILWIQNQNDIKL